MVKKIKDESSARHWIYQRVSAILLLLIFVIFLYFFCSALSRTWDKIAIIKDPYYLCFITLFILISFYHAALGVKVIIEDYINSVRCRNFFLQTLTVLSTITIIVLLCAVIYSLIFYG